MRNRPKDLADYAGEGHSPRTAETNFLSRKQAETEDVVLQRKIEQAQKALREHPFDIGVAAKMLCWCDRKNHILLSFVDKEELEGAKTYRATCFIKIRASRRNKYAAKLFWASCIFFHLAGLVRKEFGDDFLYNNDKIGELVRAEFERFEKMAGQEALLPMLHSLFRQRRKESARKRAIK